MAVADSTMALSSALLRACGIDPDYTTAVKYEHEVGDVPILTVTFSLWNVNTRELDEWVDTFEVVKKGEVAP